VLANQSKRAKSTIHLCGILYTNSPITQPKTIDLIQYEALGNKYRVCGVYSPEPRVEVGCFRLNFNISKYWAIIIHTVLGQKYICLISLR